MKRACLVACVVVVALAAAGCASGGPKPRVTQSKAAKGVIDEPARLKPMKLSEEPLWTDEALKRMDVRDVWLHSDAAVVYGRGPERDRIAVVDAATGKTRWALDALTPGLGGEAGLYAPMGESPRIADAGSDLLLIIEYATSGGGESGVAALSSKDGGLRWKTPLTGRKSTVADVAGATVFVSSMSSHGRDRPVLAALDAATGRKRWQADDFRYEGVSDGVVLGARGFEEGVSFKDSDMAVVAVDLETGGKRWDLSERFLASHVHSTQLNQFRPNIAAVAGRAAVIRGLYEVGDDLKDVKSLVIDSRSGRAITVLAETATLRECVSDGRALIACQDVGGDNSIVTYRVGARHHRVSARPYTGQRLAGVWKGRIFDSSGDSFDRSGNRIDKKLPGRFAAITGGFAAFHTTDDATDAGLVIYRVLG